MFLKTQILPEMSCWYPCGPDRGKCRPQEDPEHQSGKLNSSKILITLVAVSYDQLKMTDHVLCKTTNLDFEDEQPLSSKSELLLSIVVGFPPAPACYACTTPAQPC